MSGTQVYAALPNVAALVQRGGVMIMSLRYGPIPPGRRLFAVPADATVHLATSEGLRLNRNYGFGVSLGDCAHKPKPRDLPDQPLCLSLRRSPMEMVWPEVVVKSAIAQHVVSGG